MKICGLSCVRGNYYNYKPVVKPKFKGTPELMSIGSDNNLNYKKLKYGGYLDIHDDSFAPENKSIRKLNLSFLDNITSEDDKKDFISYYESETGFPDLEKVSKNIENEFVSSIRTVSASFFDSDYDVIAAGYDETCSVGKRMAFPGSDLDKSFIIIRGNNGRMYGESDEKIVNKFKAKLWQKTDQRILSYNHDTSFPTVMTLQQIKDKMNGINRITSCPINRTQAEHNVKSEYVDLMSAAQYNIALSKYLPVRRYDHTSDDLTKESTKNFAYFIESVRDGKKVIKTPEFDELIDDIKDSDFYKYSNVAQMTAMKNAINSGNEQKSKIIKRKNLAKEFSTWDTDKQFDFVKTLIKYSCEDQDDFEEYFKNDRDVKESYKPLLGMLCFGDENKRINPEYKIYNDWIDIYINKDRPISLYQGYAPNVLWVDSYNSNEVEDVLLYVDSLKKTKLFKNIDRVQAPILYEQNLPFNFYKIGFYTANGTGIMERML